VQKENAQKLKEERGCMLLGGWNGPDPQNWQSFKVMDANSDLIMPSNDLEELFSTMP
jgi:hypothetical protein